MTGSLALSRPTRFTTVAGVCALHAAMLAAIFLSRGAPEIIPPPSTPLRLIRIELPAPPRKENKRPAPSALPSKLAVIRKEPAPPSPSLEATKDPGKGGSCTTLATVSAAINADQEAVARIQSAPPQLRSVSGAIVIWNAGWSDGVRLPEDPLQRVRAIIENTLREVDQDCLDEQVTGPRLVAVPNGDLTMYAVLGSGIWSWAQMLLPDDVAPAPLAEKPATKIPWPKNSSSDN